MSTWIAERREVGRPSLNPDHRHHYELSDERSCGVPMGELALGRSRKTCRRSS